jgi:hypothetical protein
MIEALLKRKEILLGVLAVVMVAVLWHTFGDMILGSASANSLTPGRGQRPDLAGLRLAEIDWSSLDAQRPAYDPNGRNIFQFGVIPPLAPPPLSEAEKAAIAKAQKEAAEARAKAEAEMLEAQKRAAEQTQQQQQQQQQQQHYVAAHPPPPPPPQPPPIPYKFIGYIGPADNKVAILHDGTDVLFVRRGETLPKGIKVLDVGYESIKFGFTDPQFKNQSQTLPMSSTN